MLIRARGSAGDWGSWGTLAGTLRCSGDLLTDGGDTEDTDAGSDSLVGGLGWARLSGRELIMLVSSLLHALASSSRGLFREGELV